MGIRFRCHQCGHELHVKDFQAGKRSKCPECETKFRIPKVSAERSIPLDVSTREESTTDSASGGYAGAAAMGTLTEKLTSSIASSREGEPVVESQHDTPEEIDSVTNEPADAPPFQPQAILEAPGATWYVRPPAGGQYGPAPADIFCEWLTENRVTRDSLVWCDGWPQWLVASEVFVDYFGPAVLHALVPLGGPSAPPNESPASSHSAAPEFLAPTSLSDRALAARKRQRKQNYVIMIGILAAISVVLVIALVAVLMRNV